MTEAIREPEYIEPEYIELDQLAAVVDQMRAGERPTDAEMAGALENALDSLMVLAHVSQHVVLTEAPCPRDGCPFGADQANGGDIA